MTSCGVISKTWERCKDIISLLRAHNIRFELKDLNMNGDLADEIIDRMGLNADDRNFILMSLPLVFVNGSYFGVGFRKNISDLNSIFRTTLLWTNAMKRDT